MSSLNKGLNKVEVSLKWDPAPFGAPPCDLDLIAATYTTDALHDPDYLVHFDSRSPDGTIILNRDSKTGQGFGADEVMTLELERLAPRYIRVIVGVGIQQTGMRRTFGDVQNTAIRLREGYTELAQDDFAAVADATAARVAEFVRSGTGGWELRLGVRGYDADPQTLPYLMGATEE
ncbi:TerD family protein [Streptomyces boncukensis]|uniref:TerD family protein n=1 Tax=Streptomyces boncukensis TaxID=2711219 RepID=A0A6G4X2T9_9ACTN|nr:TerD family protein [Streptomyces boncukensis]